MDEGKTGQAGVACGNSGALALALRTASQRRLEAQKSMQRPFFSQSPKRVGSGPGRPPISRAGRSCLAGRIAAGSAGRTGAVSVLDRFSLIIAAIVHKLHKVSRQARALQDEFSRMDIPAVFRMHCGGVLEMHGADTLAFAQAQFMNDLAPLADGQWQWNGWLNPKGRVIALFAAVRRDARTLWLWLPDYPAPALAEGLSRFVFRSKVQLAPRPDLTALGEFIPAAQPSAEPARTLATLEMSLADGRARRVHLVAGDLPAADPAAEQAWLLADLRHGLPHLHRAAVEAYTPHMLSLQRLDAFSVRKGCYPGQEIVSRTHYLGQAKRGLARLHAAVHLAPGAEILAKDRPAGMVLNTVATAAGCEILAVLPQPLPETLHVAEAGLRPEALLAGLRPLA